LVDSGTFNARIGTGVHDSVGYLILTYGEDCSHSSRVSFNGSLIIDPFSTQFVVGFTKASAMPSKKSALLPYFLVNVGLLKW